VLGASAENWRSMARSSRHRRLGVAASSGINGERLEWWWARKASKAKTKNQPTTAWPEKAERYTALGSGRRRRR